MKWPSRSGPNFCGTSHKPKEGLWTLRSEKILDFRRILKIHEKYCKSAKIFIDEKMLQD